MTELTHEELTRLLDYDPETGVFRWKVDVGTKIKAGSVAGHKSYGGNRLQIEGKKYLTRRLAWFYTTGEMPNTDTFVKNRDQYDDRIDNIGILPDRPGKLTHEYLRQCLDYNSLTGSLKWKIAQSKGRYGDDAFEVQFGKNNSAICRTAILNKKYTTLRIIVFWMTGYMPSPKRVVMPIDNNLLNLKWSNIKVGSRSQSQVKKRNYGSSSMKGVYWRKDCNKYEAKIQINNKTKHLGLFKAEAEAHAAYMKAARKHHGGLANDGYQHAMYHLEYEEVPAEELTKPEAIQQALDDGILEPALVDDF